MAGQHTVGTKGRQARLPGVAPLCPHCGGRRGVEMTAASETDLTLVEAERWECRSCGGVFWSLPGLAARGGVRR